jgi:hypothetical protein
MRTTLAQGVAPLRPGGPVLEVDTSRTVDVDEGSVAQPNLGC